MVLYLSICAVKQLALEILYNLITILRIVVWLEVARAALPSHQTYILSRYIPVVDSWRADNEF